MRTFFSFFIALFISLTVNAQDITGKWHGVLQVQGVSLRLVLHVEKSGSDYKATLDSPDQGAAGIPVTKTTFDGSKITFEIQGPQISYNGELKDDEITGTFKQGALQLPLLLSRKEIKPEPLNRPQEPKEPFSYHSENVTFQNKTQNVSLAGTLTLPKKPGKFPVAILISGSGPQDRNQEILGHKPFLVISDFLTKNGIAVLRYDDRGVGESTGVFASATSADFATDVASAIDYLKSRKEIDHKKIGLIGHSEGGLIAPMIAARSNDVAFMVLLAAPGIRGDKLLLLQQELIAKDAGVPADEIAKSLDTNAKIFDLVNQFKSLDGLKPAVERHLNAEIEKAAIVVPESISAAEFVKLQSDQIATPWMHFLLTYNPTTALEKVKCPVLVLNGQKDLQVPASENISAIREALATAKNKKVTIREFPNMNHLFQETTTGSPSEYSKIEQTFSPIALIEITNWIKNQVK